MSEFTTPIVSDVMIRKVQDRDREIRRLRGVLHHILDFPVPQHVKEWSELQRHRYVNGHVREIVMAALASREYKSDFSKTDDELWRRVNAEVW